MRVAGTCFVHERARCTRRQQQKKHYESSQFIEELTPPVGSLKDHPVAKGTRIDKAGFERLFLFRFPWVPSNSGDV